MLWSMAKRNLTVQLDEDTVRRARIVAAQRGTSVSQLVAHELERLADESERYDEAWRRARQMMANARPRGGRSWTRDEL